MMTEAPFRRRAGAASLVALFVVLLASTAIDPLGDDHDNAVQLHKATGHISGLVAASALELLAAALAAVAVFWLAGLVRGRGRALADTGIVLGVAGTVGMALIGIHELFIGALAEADPAHGVAVLDRLDHLGGPVPALFFCLPVALVLLAVAVYRAGLVAAWVPAVAIVFFLFEFAPVPGAEIVQLLLGLVAFGTIAFRALATPNRRPVPATA